LQTAAIIPVKTFSKAKTRLGLAQEKTEMLCKIMLDEVLLAVSNSKIDKIFIVSKDESALQVGKKYNATPIYEQTEIGVNAAVALAERHLRKNGFQTSVVLPQDIPLVRPQDINSLLAFQNGGNSLLVVPSRRFDGTNALVRSPVDIIETHYDEDSYKIHLNTGKSRGIPTSFVLIPRIMLDIDNRADIEYIMSNVEKPRFVDELKSLVGKR
jgi:2-phospho-L-lactate guanylyltransferase